MGYFILGALIAMASFCVGYIIVIGVLVALWYIAEK